MTKIKHGFGFLIAKRVQISRENSLKGSLSLIVKAMLKAGMEELIGVRGLFS